MNNEPASLQVKGVAGSGLAPAFMNLYEDEHGRCVRSAGREGARCVQDGYGRQLGWISRTSPAPAARPMRIRSVKYVAAVVVRRIL